MRVIARLVIVNNSIINENEPLFYDLLLVTMHINITQKVDSLKPKT